MIRAAIIVLVLAAIACKSKPEKKPPPAAPTPSAHGTTPPTGEGSGSSDPYALARGRMIDDTIRGRDIKDSRVIKAMSRVAREEFVPAELRARAYEDNPLPIGFDQTISQPYVVAAMTQAAEIQRGEKVLEVGTGSGYQAAVLAELGADVYSIEILEPLAKRTHAILARLGYTKLHLKIGDGADGWPDAAPFDAIIVTAAPEKVPQPLIEQLAEGGRLVIPVGKEGNQQLRVITKGPDDTTTDTLFPVRFVPMTGKAQGR